MMENALLIAGDACFWSLCHSASQPLPFSSWRDICWQGDQSWALMSWLQCQSTQKIRRRGIKSLKCRGSSWIQNDECAASSLVLLSVWLWIKYPNTTWDPLKMYWSLWGNWAAVTAGVKLFSEEKKTTTAETQRWALYSQILQQKSDRTQNLLISSLLYTWY